MFFVSSSCNLSVVTLSLWLHSLCCDRKGSCVWLGGMFSWFLMYWATWSQTILTSMCHTFFYICQVIVMFCSRLSRTAYMLSHSGFLTYNIKATSAAHLLELILQITTTMQIIECIDFKRVHTYNKNFFKVNTGRQYENVANSAIMWLLQENTSILSFLFMDIIPIKCYKLRICCNNIQILYYILDMWQGQHCPTRACGIRWHLSQSLWLKLTFLIGKSINSKVGMFKSFFFFFLIGTAPFILKIWIFEIFLTVDLCKKIWQITRFPWKLVIMDWFVVVGWVGGCGRGVVSM